MEGIKTIHRNIKEDNINTMIGIMVIEIN